MTKKKAYDVFISYRREGGLDFARSIAYYLRIEGFQCFFDQRELKTGQFNQQIYEAIDNSKYFLSVLTKGALERCSNPDDWVRKEIEHAIEKGIQIVPVAVRDEKLTFPESLPKSLSTLKTTQASFIDRQTDFEESILKMVREQLKGLSGMTTRQHKKTRREAEAVFLKKADRFKRNDGVINDDEFMELERLASACGINRNRLEELVEKVEAAAARRAAMLKWIKCHPKIVASFGLAGLLLLGLLVAWLWAMIPSSREESALSAAGQFGSSALTADSRSKKKNATRDINAAAEELARLDESCRRDAENDFRSSLLYDVVSDTSGFDQVGKRIAEEYMAAAAEGKKLSALGMRSEELVKSRPDLVIKFADIRIRVVSEMQELIRGNRHEEALKYYNSAKEAFDRLHMRYLDRPSFSGS